MTRSDPDYDPSNGKDQPSHYDSNTSEPSQNPFPSSLIPPSMQNNRNFGRKPVPEIKFNQNLSSSSSLPQLGGSNGVPMEGFFASPASFFNNNLSSIAESLTKPVEFVVHKKSESTSNTPTNDPDRLEEGAMEMFRYVPQSMKENKKESLADSKLIHSHRMASAFSFNKSFSKEGLGKDFSKGKDFGKEFSKKDSKVRHSFHRKPSESSETFKGITTSIEVREICQLDAWKKIIQNNKNMFKPDSFRRSDTIRSLAETVDHKVDKTDKLGPESPDLERKPEFERKRLSRDMEMSWALNRFTNFPDELVIDLDLFNEEDLKDRELNALRLSLKQLSTHNTKVYPYQMYVYPPKISRPTSKRESFWNLHSDEESDDKESEWSENEDEQQVAKADDGLESDFENEFMDDEVNDLKDGFDGKSNDLDELLNEADDRDGNIEDELEFELEKELELDNESDELNNLENELENELMNSATQLTIASTTDQSKPDELSEYRPFGELEESEVRLNLYDYGHNWYKFRNQLDSNLTLSHFVEFEHNLKSKYNICSDEWMEEEASNEGLILKLYSVSETNLSLLLHFKHPEVTNIVNSQIYDLNSSNILYKAVQQVEDTTPKDELLMALEEGSAVGGTQSASADNASTVSANKDSPSKEGKDGKDSKEGKDTKETKESKDSKDSKDSKSKDSKDASKELEKELDKEAPKSEEVLLTGKESDVRRQWRKRLQGIDKQKRLKLVNQGVSLSYLDSETILESSRNYDFVFEFEEVSSMLKSADYIGILNHSFDAHYAASNPHEVGPEDEILNKRDLIHTRVARNLVGILPVVGKSSKIHLSRFHRPDFRTGLFTMSVAYFKGIIANFKKKNKHLDLNIEVKPDHGSTTAASQLASQITSSMSSQDVTLSASQTVNTTSSQATNTDTTQDSLLNKTDTADSASVMTQSQLDQTDESQKSSAHPDKQPDQPQEDEGVGISWDVYPVVKSLINLNFKDDDLIDGVQNHCSNYFVNSSDLSLVDDTKLVLLEYVEKQPLLLNNLGMASRIDTYINSPSGESVFSHDSPERREELLGNITYTHEYELFGANHLLKQNDMQSILENTLYKAPIFYRSSSPKHYSVSPFFPGATTTNTPMSRDNLDHDPGINLDTGTDGTDSQTDFTHTNNTLDFGAPLHTHGSTTNTVDRSKNSRMYDFLLVRTKPSDNSLYNDFSPNTPSMPNSKSPRGKAEPREIMRIRSFDDNLVLGVVGQCEPKVLVSNPKSKRFVDDNKTLLKAWVIKMAMTNPGTDVKRLRKIARKKFYPLIPDKEITSVLKQIESTPIFSTRPHALENTLQATIKPEVICSMESTRAQKIRLKSLGIHHLKTHEGMATVSAILSQQESHFANSIAQARQKLSELRKAYYTRMVTLNVDENIIKEKIRYFNVPISEYTLYGHLPFTSTDANANKTSNSDSAGSNDHSPSNEAKANSKPSKNELLAKAKTDLDKFDLRNRGNISMRVDYIEKILKVSSWNITHDVKLVLKGNGQFSIYGVGDPSNSGLALSLIKRQANLATSAAATGNIYNITVGSQSNEDLRKLSMEELSKRLQLYGVSEAIIKTLPRWDQVALVRQYRDGYGAALNVDDTVNKFRIPPHEYKNQLSKVIQKQKEALTQPITSSPLSLNNLNTFRTVIEKEVLLNPLKTMLSDGDLVSQKHEYRPEETFDDVDKELEELKLLKESLSLKRNLDLVIEDDKLIPVPGLMWLRQSRKTPSEPFGNERAVFIYGEKNIEKVLKWRRQCIERDKTAIINDPLYGVNLGKRACRNCGQPGHISSNPKCPLYAGDKLKHEPAYLKHLLQKKQEYEVESSEDELVTKPAALIKDTKEYIKSSIGSFKPIDSDAELAEFPIHSADQATHLVQDQKPKVGHPGSSVGSSKRRRTALDGKDDAQSKNISSTDLKTLNKILVTIEKETRYRPFVSKIPEAIAPNYYKIIKHPVWLSLLKMRLKSKHYTDISDLVNDIFLLEINCKMYNSEQSQNAWLRKMSQVLVDDLINRIKHHIQNKNQVEIVKQMHLGHINNYRNQMTQLSQLSQMTQLSDMNSQMSDMNLTSQFSMDSQLSSLPVSSTDYTMSGMSSEPMGSMNQSGMMTENDPSSTMGQFTAGMEQFKADMAQFNSGMGQFGTHFQQFEGGMDQFGNNFGQFGADMSQFADTGGAQYVLKDNGEMVKIDLSDYAQMANDPSGNYGMGEQMAGMGESGVDDMMGMDPMGVDPMDLDNNLNSVDNSADNSLVNGQDDGSVANSSVDNNSASVDSSVVNMDNNSVATSVDDSLI